MRDHIEFYRQFRTRFKTTGAVAPSSRFLSRAMTRPLAARNGAVRVLEIGPGTGAVTRQIVRLLGPGDRLDLVELNTTFAGMLETRFQSDPAYQQVAPQSRIHVCPIEEFRSEERYDFILSGLPLNNFPADLVRDIFRICFDLLAPGGVLSYFEYMYVRPLRRCVAHRDEKTRLAALEEVLQTYLSEHHLRTDWVFANLPPAWVQHLRAERNGGPALRNGTVVADN